MILSKHLLCSENICRKKMTPITKENQVNEILVGNITEKNEPDPVKPFRDTPPFKKVVLKASHIVY
jgi:hypothetical protein